MPFSVYLVFPPMWSPKQPYLSLPSLTAYLKMHDFQVRQRDLNIETYNDFLDDDQIARAVRRIEERLSTLETKPAISFEEVNEYTALARAATAAPHIAAGLNNANALIRTPGDFYDPGRFTRARKIQDEAFKIISAAHYPALFDFFKLQFKHPYFSSRAVREAARDRENNFLIDYFEEKVIPDLLRERPDVMGLSICSPDQLIPAVTLADLTKKMMPDLPIYAGGGFYTNIYEGKRTLCPEALFLDFFDGIVIYEGEIPLLQVCRTLRSGDREGLKGIPNLIRKEGGKVQVSEKIVWEDMNRLPTPDFSGFPLADYFYPEPVLPLLTSRGCYWKRCAFCTSFDVYQSGFRQRQVDRVISDIRSLQNEYGTNCIFFSDQAMTPAFLKRFSERMMDEKINLHWAFEGRFEGQFTSDFLLRMKEAGCVKILFGLESACQRVLDLMDKGYKLDVVSRILDDCLAAEIAVHLFMIIGFPTETRSEAEESLRFILDRQHLLDSPGFSHVFHKFGLDLGSRVSKNPSDYKLVNLSIPVEHDLAFMMDYDQLAPDALSQREMEALIEAFDARINKAAAKTGYPKSMIDDLLYLIHYGWRNHLLEQENTGPQRIPPSDFEAYLRMKPRRSDDLAVSTFKEFSPVSEGKAKETWVKKGEILYFYNVSEGTFGGLGGEGYALLCLCDGLKTVEQVCRDFASGGDGKILFFRAAQLLKNLYKMGLIDL